MSQPRVDDATVRKVASLAKLALSDAEVAQLTAELGQIVHYVDQLSEIDTDAVEPLDHAMDLTNALRDDVIRPSLDRTQALQNAPQADDETFLVPPVL